MAVSVWRCRQSASARRLRWGSHHSNRMSVCLLPHATRGSRRMLHSTNWGIQDPQGEDHYEDHPRSICEPRACSAHPIVAVTQRLGSQPALKAGLGQARAGSGQDSPHDSPPEPSSSSFFKASSAGPISTGNPPVQNTMSETRLSERPLHKVSHGQMKFAGGERKASRPQFLN